MISQRGRLYKTGCQLVKSQLNILNHFGIYVRSVYIQLNAGKFYH